MPTIASSPLFTSGTEGFNGIAIDGMKNSIWTEWKCIFYVIINGNAIEALLHLAYLSNTLLGQITTPVTLGIKGQNF